MNDPYAAIAELRANWARLHDLDRADAIFSMHQSGVKLRHLARELNCSEGLLRHLLKAREASAEDRYFARQNLISTRELARRAGRARRPLQLQSNEAAEFERARAALDISKEICEWLVREQIDAEAKKEIVRWARKFLESAERDGTVPRRLPPVGTTTADMILECRPPLPIPDGPEAISWYGRWLSGWLANRASDRQMRDSALRLAEHAAHAL